MTKQVVCKRCGTPKRYAKRIKCIVIRPIRYTWSELEVAYKEHLFPKLKEVANAKQ